MTILIWMIMIITPIFPDGTQATIDLGPLHDCTKAIRLGIYAYPEERNCTKLLQQDAKARITFRILHYQPHVSMLEIYSCRVERWFEKCDHGYLRSGTHTIRRLADVEVSPAECWIGASTKLWRRQYLKKYPGGLLASRMVSRGSCGHSERYERNHLRFIMGQHAGKQIGNNPTIEQNIFKKRMLLPLTKRRKVRLMCILNKTYLSLGKSPS